MKRNTSASPSAVSEATQQKGPRSEKEFRFRYSDLKEAVRAIRFQSALQRVPTGSEQPIEDPERWERLAEASLGESSSRSGEIFPSGEGLGLVAVSLESRQGRGSWLAPKHGEISTLGWQFS